VSGADFRFRLLVPGGCPLRLLLVACLVLVAGPLSLPGTVESEVECWCSICETAESAEHFRLDAIKAGASSRADEDCLVVFLLLLFRVLDLVTVADEGFRVVGTLSDEVVVEAVTVTGAV
jgi:hypothetical protein